MTFKRVVPRQQAIRDVDEAIDYYLVEAGNAVAPGFVDALERASDHIAHHPLDRIAPIRPRTGLTASPILAFEALSVRDLLCRTK